MGFIEFASNTKTESLEGWSRIHLIRSLTLGPLDSDDEPFDVNELVDILMLVVNLRTLDLRGNLVPAIGIACHSCSDYLRNLTICLRNDDELMALTYLHHFRLLRRLDIEFTTHKCTLAFGFPSLGGCICVVSRFFPFTRDGRSAKTQAPTRGQV
jgi:hypothetical protein